MADVSPAHIANTALLFMPQVGNVPVPPRAGQRGLMNWGLIEWRDMNGNPPGAGEIDALAALYNVGRRTVQRWFGAAMPGEAAQYRNCVSTRECFGNNYAPTDPRYRPRKRFCSLSVKEQSKGFLAACLGVTDGLCRVDAEGNWEPIYTKSDRRGRLLVYTERFARPSLASCLLLIDRMYNGVEYDTQGLPYALAWLQLRIEKTPGGWDVVIKRSYPQDGDLSDDNQCAEAEQGAGEI